MKESITKTDPLSEEEAVDTDALGPPDPYSIELRPKREGCIGSIGSRSRVRGRARSRQTGGRGNGTGSPGSIPAQTTQYQAATSETQIKEPTVKEEELEEPEEEKEQEEKEKQTRKHVQQEKKEEEQEEEEGEEQEKEQEEAEQEEGKAEEEETKEGKQGPKGKRGRKRVKTPEVVEVVIAKRNIRMGATLTRGDVEPFLIPKASFTRSMLTDVSQAVGKVAARNIRRGVILKWYMLNATIVKSAHAIRKGAVLAQKDVRADLIAALRFTTDMLRITAQAIGKTALKDIRAKTILKWQRDVKR